jgi:hypothetical protein
MNAFALHVSVSVYRFRWLHLPAAVLIALLQRTPVIRAVATADVLFAANAGVVLKSIFAGAVALGAVDTLVGATQLTANPASPASATVGQAFQAAVSITGAPLVPGSYEVRGDLAPGLSINGLNGDLVNASSLAISGTPTTAGTYTLNIRAWAEANKSGLGGSPTFNYTINVGGGATQTAPVFTTQPQSQTVSVGSNVNFSVAVTGSPAPTLQWRRDGTDLAGATGATLSLTNVQTTHAGNYTVVATNTAGTATSNAAVLTVTSGNTNAPTINLQPLSVNARAGTVVALTVGAAGATSYQWRKDGVAVTGGTAEILAIDNVGAADAGSYTVEVSNAQGSVTSTAATLTVASTDPSRIVNMSVRTNLGSGQVLIVGFVSSGEKNMLVRAAGPSLVSIAPDLAGSVLTDPRIVFYDGQTPIDSNDDWDDALTPVFASVGAFPFIPGARDGALRRAISGARSAHVSGPGSGIVLVECYDSGGSGRLVNVSARNRVGTGSDVLIAGFFIEGPSAKTLLIRGIGPKLADLGVSGVLANPKLEVYRGTTKVAENDDWNNAFVALANRAGAGGLPIPVGGRDAALVITLNPGLHSAIVSGVNNSTGEALVEVYEMP